MCGICGVVDFHRRERAELDVRRMMAALEHRGPDDHGALSTPPAVLGIRRLSIIDLPGGGQPIFNEDRTLALVFNGEIYNFRELRLTLEGLGHRFLTRSDSETIVHAYEAWGSDCVRHLQGMFAFAVLELPRGGGAATRLFLARDRLGIKPLYYAWDGGAFLFASEVRALLATGRLSPRLAPRALESYLLFGSVCEPGTLIEGIYSLPPGQRMSVELADPFPAVSPEAYWDIPRAPGVEPPPYQRGDHDRRAAVQQVRRLLEDSVRRHLIADVPLGIFLSSGLDSAALAGLASRERADVHTITVAFPEQQFSEAPAARRTAQQFGTQHQELILTGEEMLLRAEEAVAALDQPSMDGINTFFVSWAARQAGLKVALSGLGGDEVFGGYPTFRSTPRVRGLARLASQWPPQVRRAAAALLASVGSRTGFADPSRKLAATCAAPDSLPHPYFFARALFLPDQVERLRGGAAAVGAAPAKEAPWRAWLAEQIREAEGADDFGTVSRLELRSYLVNTLLRDTDAMSMAHSLEVRVPFLDHPLVEYVTQLPEGLKGGRGPNKGLLVDALGDLLPTEVIGQRKRTFTLPWDHWLRGPIREQVGTRLTQLTPSLGALLYPGAVRGVWHDFLGGRTSWSRPWSLYVLDRWVARHVDGTAGFPAVVEAATVAASSRATSAGGTNR